MSNKKIFEKFYNEHLDKVYRFIFFRVANNKDVTEDLVSEIFIKALKAFDNYDQSISKSAWIMTIAKNHLANYWRDKKDTLSIYDNYNTESDETNDLVPAINNFAKGQKDKEVASDLVDFLSILNDSEREIVTLHYISGYNYAEIAEMLAMSAVAVKVAAHRAVKKMRQKI